MKMKWKRKIALLLAALLMLLVLAVVACADDSGAFFDTTPFAGKRIGVQTGSIAVDTAPDMVENPELLYFSSCPEMIPALTGGKLDACIMEEPILQYLASQVEGVRVERLESAPDQLAFLANKDETGEALMQQVNDFLAQAEESGQLEKIREKWFEGTEEERVMEDYTQLPDTNGTLIIASEPAYAPFEYMKNGAPVGYDLELIGLFCEAYGYRPVIEVCEFSSIIAGVTSGKYDIGASGFTVTEERKKAVTFSDPVMEVYMSIGFMDTSAATTGSIFSTIGESLQRTFVEEERWKEFLSGALVTMEITVLSILAGTVLGFFVHMLCRGKHPVFRAISKAVRWLVGGMPTVVLLMVLYYIIFGKSSIPGETVAILGFTICFACAMHGMMESGEAALEPGQAIAAEAMGYSKNQTFLRILFPQSVRHFLPSYLTEISNHIKATAVVGYIAVVDITKVGDLIRGRTYDAFFPLIAVAVSYFIMAGILRIIVRKISGITDPMVRSEAKILGGAVIR